MTRLAVEIEQLVELGKLDIHPLFYLDIHALFCRVPKEDKQSLRNKDRHWLGGTRAGNRIFSLSMPASTLPSDVR